MADYEKIANWNAKQRGGSIIKTKHGVYYYENGETEPSELHKDYEEYIKDMWARRNKPYRWNKKH